MSASVAGFVLAGGRSLRMGRDKALLELDGETLLARGLRQLAEVCPQVAIAGGAPELASFATLIPDQSSGEGPLSGVLAALAWTRCRWNLFCPVDVPFVPATAWARLLAEIPPDSSSEASVAVLARVGGQAQPLCGLYRTEALPALRAQLECGQRKVTAAIEAAGNVLWIDFDEPGQTGWFRNLNTPEDYAAMAHPKP